MPGFIHNPCISDINYNSISLPCKGLRFVQQALNKYDKNEYQKYTQKSEFDKAIHTLQGLMNGISIDNNINKEELDELKNWCLTNYQFTSKQPFKELIPFILESIEDEYLDDEEKENILWFCRNYQPDSQFYDIITNEIQVLHGILHGILADNKITKIEVRNLMAWMDERDYLKGSYPFDELYSILLSVIQDNIIDKEEENSLKAFFSQFIKENKISTINFDELKSLAETIDLPRVCSVDPEIHFKNKCFCFTGKSSKAKRSEIQSIIQTLGGLYSNGVTNNVDYLIVGDNGNPCWAFSCYGRKVEQAIKLRKKTNRPIIIHEIDFWDRYEDFK